MTGWKSGMKITAVAQKMQSLFDALILKIWPSTQGNFDYNIYADLVGYLYSCRKSIFFGALGAAIIMASVAVHDEIHSIIFYLMFFYLPISIARLLHVDAFKAENVAERTARIALHEARYFFMTMLNTVSLAIMTIAVMIYGQDEARLAVTCVIVGIATGIAGRNASMPKLVLVQTSTLLMPVVVGLLITGVPLLVVIALLTVMFFISMQQTTARLRSDTIEAREQASLAGHLARYDTLTDLPNRLHFNSVLDAHIKQGTPIGVIYLDIDHFKKINDANGLPAGDELLKLVGQRLKAVVPAGTAMLARFGGDEFVIMTSDSPQALAKAIASALTEPFLIDKLCLTVTASIGISPRSVSARSNAVDLVKFADLALYRAKQDGRNRAVVFDESMASDSNMRVVMEQRFRLALRQGRIDLHYQPIIDLETGKVIAAEALARWTDEVVGTVRPDQFVALAEDIGLIDEFGEYVLNKACLDAVNWDPGIMVAVNVSALQFRNTKRFYQAVRQALRLSRLPGSRLTLEITEGTMVHDFDVVRNVMLNIKKMGVAFALDDFGSGYCSLNYLDRLPFDKVKIDRSLVIMANTNKTQEIIIKMVSLIAREQSAIVVVEGIETQAQAIHMRQLGATHAQGYFFGRPVADQSALIAAGTKSLLRA
jgi:diguanylate cyclase (GGDEF)-like protein